MNPLFCDCCGDNVKAVYPCKFVYHDELEVKLNICLDCMYSGKLVINLKRKRQIARILKDLSVKNKWKERSQVF